MFRNIRRKDRMLTKEAALEILLKGEYGILSTIGSDGYPYGVPVNYDVINNEIYFHGANGIGHKFDNIRFSNKVSFTVVTKSTVDAEHLTTKYTSAVVFGRIYEVTENKELYLEKMVDKFAPDFKEKGLEEIKTSAAKTGIYKITIEHISGKSNINK